MFFPINCFYMYVHTHTHSHSLTHTVTHTHILTYKLLSLNDASPVCVFRADYWEWDSWQVCFSLHKDDFPYSQHSSSPANFYLGLRPPGLCPLLQLYCFSHSAHGKAAMMVRFHGYSCWHYLGTKLHSKSSDPLPLAWCFPATRCRDYWGGVVLLYLNTYALEWGSRTLYFDCYTFAFSMGKRNFFDGSWQLYISVSVRTHS